MLFSSKRSFFISTSASLLCHGLVVVLLSQILFVPPVSVPHFKESEPFFVIQEEPIPLASKEIPAPEKIPEVSESIPVSEPKEPFSPLEPVERTPEISSVPLRKNEFQEKIQEWWTQESESVEKMQQEITQQTKLGLTWLSLQTRMVPRYVSRFTQIRVPLVAKKAEPVIQKNISTPKETPVIQKEPSEESLPFRKARLKKQLPLQYPSFGERMGYEGLVKLRVFLSETGAVLNIEIVESSSYKVLDESAQEQVAKWIFEPAFRGETPVESVLQIPVRFKLN